MGYILIGWLFVGPIASAIGCTLIVLRHAEAAWDRFYRLGVEHGRELEAFDRDGDAILARVEGGAP
jgi:hypothetical protein